jgi:hypothetical protein
MLCCLVEVVLFLVEGELSLVEVKLFGRGSETTQPLPNNLTSTKRLNLYQKQLNLYQKQLNFYQKQLNLYQKQLSGRG